VRVALLDLTGQKERSENLLAELSSSQIPGRAVGIAYFYTVTGNLDQAAVWWEKAIEQRVPLVVHLVSSPLTKPIRESSHSSRLAKLMKLPGSKAWAHKFQGLACGDKPARETRLIWVNDAALIAEARKPHSGVVFGA